MNDDPVVTLQRIRRERGFTLIELIIVVTLGAILLAIGLPSLNDLIGNQKVRGAANDLFMDFSYARSEAIKRNVNVDVIRAGSSWTEGWTVQIGATVLRSQPGVTGVTYSGASASTITFRPDGRTSAATDLTFDFYSGNTLVNKRCVAIGPSGRPAVRTDRNRDENCANG